MYETNVTSEPIEPSKTKDKGAQTDNNNGKGVLKMSLAEKTNYCEWNTNFHTIVVVFFLDPW